MRFMSDVHGHEPDAFDRLLEDVERCPALATPTSKCAWRSVCPRPPSQASSRAAREGRDVAEVVADALRTAAAEQAPQSAAAWRRGPRRRRNFGARSRIVLSGTSGSSC
jgi:hypothetical protein